MKHCQTLVGTVFPAPEGGYFVFDYMDHHKNHGGVKWYETQEEALKVVHDFSKVQFEEWHKVNCFVCKSEAGK